MRKETAATFAGVAFSVALTATPGIQNKWLATASWLITALGAWRWYYSSQSDTHAFTGVFFTPPPIDRQDRRTQRPRWIEVELGAMAVGPGVGTETAVSVQILIRNLSPSALARLKFFLVDRVITERSGRTSFVAAASEHDVKSRNIPVAPGFPDDLFSPVQIQPKSEIKGNLWFFHPVRETLPFSAVLVDDSETGALWSVPIDAGYAAAVASNPRRSIIWPGRDL